MEYRTCEQYVLGELEAEQKENARLRSMVAELERERDEALAKKAESQDGDVEPRQVQMLKLNEPFETAYLTVKDVYDFRRKEGGLNLTAEEAREKAATEDGLREVAKMHCGWSWSGQAMSVDTRIWPFTLRTGTQTFVMDVYNGGRDVTESRVCKDDEEACCGQYFPAYRAEELERVGLGLLKERLLEYADKLDAEEERA